MLDGKLCNEIRVLDGHFQASSRVADVSYKVSAKTPEGEQFQGRPAAALYREVFVVAGSSSTGYSPAPDLIDGLDFSTGEHLWQFRCPDEEPLTLRYSGKWDPIRPGRSSNPDEPTAVLVGCSSGSLWLDPATGTPMR